MLKSQKEFLYKLLEIESPTGFEMPLQRIWANSLRSVAEEVNCDAYGSTWGKLSGKTKRKVILSAHADEIGFIVKYIGEDGLISLERIGGIDVSIASARRLKFLGEKGKVFGVIGNIAIHLRKDKSKSATTPMHELWVDVGVDSLAKAKKLGIRVGTPAVYVDGPQDLGKDRIVSRALDNRIGSYIISEAFRKVANSRKTLNFDLFALNTTQEEIGGHGAKMSAYRLDPDLVICIDVTHATDVPGIDVKQHGQVTLGGGPTVSDGSSNHPLICEKLREVAKKQKISLQQESAGSYTSTDNDSFFNVKNGIPSALVSVPLRNMHSPVETVHQRDVQNTIDLLAEFVLSLKAKDSFCFSLD